MIKKRFAGTFKKVNVWPMVLIMSCLIAATPARAYASDGFLGGLQDLVGAREVDTTSYEQDYLDEYEGGLRANPPDPGTNQLIDLGEDATTVDYVNVTLDSYNTVSWVGSGRRENLLDGIKKLIGAANTPTGEQFQTMLILPAVGLVFMWWGVRKSLRVLMGGFRKGSIDI